MPFSAYLNSKREDCRALVQALGKHFAFVSVLGTDVSATVIRADRKSSAVQDGRGECGFVVKMHDGRSFFEYSLGEEAVKLEIEAFVFMEAFISHRKHVFDAVHEAAPFFAAAAVAVDAINRISFCKFNLTLL